MSEPYSYIELAVHKKEDYNEIISSKHIYRLISATYPPTLADREAAYKELQKTVGVDCDVCKGTGYLSWHKAVEHYGSIADVRFEHVIEDCEDCQGHGYVCAYCKLSEVLCKCGGDK